MSYILNALRKSEQERQARQPDTLTNRITVPQVRRNPHTGKIIAMLILLNLGILTYFVGFAPQQPPVVAEQEKPAIKPLEVLRSTPKPVIQPSKVVEPKQAPVIKPSEIKPTVVASKPVVETKPLIPPSNPVVVPPPVPVQPAPSPEPIVKSEPVQVVAAKPEPEAVPVKHDLPFLEELPAEFSRGVPGFTINVFGYSANPAESFVMIDMVKYKPGMRIKDELELKEIRRDSLVVYYNEHTFRIRRP